MILSWPYDYLFNPIRPPCERGEPLPPEDCRFVLWDTERPDLGLVYVMHPIAPEM